MSLSTLSSSSSPTKQSTSKQAKPKPSASKLKQFTSKVKSRMGAAQSLTIHGSFGVRTAFKASEVAASASIPITSLVATRPAPPPPASPQREQQDDSNDSSSRQRSASPAPTEPCDVELTQEECVDALKAMGIKVRDYAYAPRKPALPTVPPASSSANIPTSNSPSTSTSSQTDPEPAPQPEKDELRRPTAVLWSPDSALAEYDVRVASLTRTYPITGRTLSRLLEIGWVTEEEALEDCHEMDWEAMYKYRALCLKKSTTERWQDGEYPWKFLWTRGADRGKPNMKTRMVLMDAERRMRAYVDRACRDEEVRRARAEREREQEEKDAALIRRMKENGELWEVPFVGADADFGDVDNADVDDVEMIAPEVGRNKRMSPDSFDEDEEQEQENSPRRRSAKRRRVSPTPLAVVPSMPPQYPAPLHTYHPEIRHQVQAAKEFARSKPLSSSSQSQPSSQHHSASQSQHSRSRSHRHSHSQSTKATESPSHSAPSERSDTPPPPGCDTPPSTSRATTPIVEEPKPKPRTLGRRLSRTTTFTQII
ncbi:hypothetical protein PC9H_011170 [Pleurotus ostreatus]|uniref:Uncharacterized protein n=1 Tax=Pleurotus ostreatus TaxID=5322 RepID=A0A8H6ZP46_PLEOS|nr:uncharacterized protein PC9H_011170 [Pleurotus ostreatus]KAF7423006.1 hypothetical protein PC9H_011170 [Pleurotus ostreatus]